MDDGGIQSSVEEELVQVGDNHRILMPNHCGLQGSPKAFYMKNQQIDLTRLDIGGRIASQSIIVSIK